MMSPLDRSYSILGIDPSLRATGWAQYDTDFRQYDYGTISCKKLRGVERLAYMQEQLYLLLTNQNPDLVVYEDYSLSSNNRSHATGELGGVFHLLIYKMKYPCLYVPPKSLKVFISGNGNADKDQMVACIKDRCEIEELISDDEADALGLVMMGRAYLKDTRVRAAKAKSTLKKCILVSGKK